MALILENVINDVFVERSFTALYAVSIAILVIFVVRGFAMFGQAVILSQISNAIILQLQVKLFRRVLSKEPSFIISSSSGEIMTLVAQSATAATAVLNTLATAVGRDVFTIIGLLAVLFIQNYALALGILLSVPIIGLVVSQITKRVRSISRQHIQVGVLLSNEIRAGVQGIKVVKSFGIEDKIINSMEGKAQNLRKLANKQAVVSNRLAPFMELIGGIIASIAVAVGGWHVIEKGYSPGELVSFMFAALMIYDPARRLGQARTTLEPSLVKIRLMYDFMDKIDHDRDQPNARPLDISNGDITFEKVTFGYDKDIPILKDISFTFKGGQTTAIVGQSGGGKTTIANLLLRFWRVDEGRIFIDDQNINEVSVQSLREHIAYVGQEPFLFDGSIRQNILVGKTNASEADLVEAARAANAYDFIQSMPNGFDTPVGELGGTLSGGQRQRIAIARALLRDAKIVLLDEPTSALDGETEREIQNALNKLSKGRTTVVIAHRLSTIRNADKIIVVADGKIGEMGTHTELIMKQGTYANLYSEGKKPGHADV